MIKTDRYYSFADVARILRISRQTVYNWNTAGKIKAVKYGKEYRITETELKRILKEGV